MRRLVGSEREDVFGRIEKMFAETDRLQRLYTPLAQKLIPIAEQLDLADAPRGRRVKLKADDWPDQHKAGVDMCMGLKIEWI